VQTLGSGATTLSAGNNLTLGTTLSGDPATVLASKDINVLGGNVVSTKCTRLAATSTSQQTDFKQEKESGLLSSGSIRKIEGQFTNSVVFEIGKLPSCNMLKTFTFLSFAWNLCKYLWRHPFFFIFFAIS